MSGIKLGVARRHKTRKTEIAQLAHGRCLLIDDVLRLQVAVYDADTDSHVWLDAPSGANLPLHELPLGVANQNASQHKEDSSGRT